MILDELFSMDRSVESISTEPLKKSVDENLYTINLTDAADGVYKAKIRFIPNFRNIKSSILSKYGYWLTEANGENGIYVDDPSTIGEKSPIGEMYWKLKNSKNPVENNLSENLKRNRKHYSLIQVIEDPQHPEYEGRLMVFSYGFKIKEKIDSEIEDKEDGSNPFDVLSGRVFRLEAKKVSGFQNYDSSKFVGVPVPITINGKKMTASDSDKAKIVEYLKESPELENYGFKHWSAELTEQVNERLRTYKSDAKSPATVEHAVSQDEDDDYLVPKKKSSSTDDEFLDGIDL